jgi:hypothetical protein
MALKRRTVSWTRLLIFAVWDVVLVAVLIAVLSTTPVSWGGAIIIIAVGAFTNFDLFLDLFLNTDVAPLRQDLSTGVVRVERYEITDVVQMEEYEDLGPAFFLRQKDDSVLFLMGQYLDDVAAREEFPCTAIELVRAPRSRFVVEMTCMGTRLSPSRIIGPFRSELVREGALPLDAETIRVDWSRIAETYA